MSWKTSLAVVFSILLAAGSAAAQTFDPAALLDSPIKVDAERHAVSATVACTLALPGAALFGVDDIPDSGPLVEFFGNELFGSFRVFHFDEGCSLLGSWATSFVGTTSTGITYDAANGTYWVVDSFVSTAVHEFVSFTGLPTGMFRPLPPGFPGVWGPIAIDSNQPGKLAYVEDIAADIIIEIDLVTGGPGCSFPNPGGGFGNGLGDAIDPASCSGTTLVVSSGTLGEGQVTKVIQTDCSLITCQTWDLMTPLDPYGEFFPNGIEEFRRGATGAPGMCVMGNATSTVFFLDKGANLADCQNVDADAAVLYVNGVQGGGDFVVDIGATAPNTAAIQKPGGAGTGKYVVHQNAGNPLLGSVTTLPASLGVSCFPFLLPPFGSASPVSVWNNIGKTGRVGSSKYFGVAIPDPARAPAIFLQLPSGDPVNMPVGSRWTLQGIIVNPAASSPKGASLTNAVGVLVK